MNEVKDLVEFFKLTCNEEDGYCSTSGDKWYTDWEREIAKPAMKARGYTNIRFITTDGDSFGPLVRQARCNDPEGNPCTFFYG